MPEKNETLKTPSSICQELVIYSYQSGIIEDMDFDLLQEKADLGRANIMMGQTFDGGQPVDILKYALLIMDLESIFASRGIEAKSTWLIADHFISVINRDSEKDEVKRQTNNRISYLEKINEVFGGNIAITLSSQLSRTPSYIENLSKLINESNINKEFKEAALLAVPEDRRSNPDALIYPFEEIATIESLHTDIKVGPVYEKKYDKPARDIAPRIGFTKYAGIYGAKGYLYGNPHIPKKLKSEIEEFGILPYKKDSKKLGDYRIDPLNDSSEKVRELVFSTEDPRALLDLINIAFLAQKKLERIEEPKASRSFIETEHRLEYLRNLAFDLYICYIYIPLHE